MKRFFLGAAPPGVALSAFLDVALSAFFALAPVSLSAGETLRHPESLETQLKSTDPAELARQSRLRGSPERGAILFFKSAAGCVQCHAEGDAATPLGPDLSQLGPEATPRHIIESLLFPSRKIREGYETVSILTVDGRVVRGMVARDGSDRLVLRDASDLQQEVAVPKSEIEAVRRSEKSMMPDGLLAVFSELRDVYDLASYVIEVAEGGPQRAAQLKPDAETLAIKDDTANLDHAGILKRLGRRDLEAGRQIYEGYCYNCHGVDGNTPSLPTARAFGTEKLKFGGDPYRMFLTLSRGGGLMAPMSHLTPKERYQVVYYIREAFMKGSNPSYVPVDEEYLAGLPEGSDSGETLPTVQRDYGPALASQLGRRVNSALTIRLDDVSIAYDLHTMDVAGVWAGGFLDLDETQHQRGRGEGTAEPAGPRIEGLETWKWAHGGTLDYSTADVPPRGPLPDRWMHYRGHYRHGNEVILSYAIDGREILERPRRVESSGVADSLPSLAHTLRIGPGRSLRLAVGRVPGEAAAGRASFVRGDATDATAAADATDADGIPASRLVVPRRGDGGPDMPYLAAVVRGETSGMTWELDDRDRLVLQIPASERPRLVEVVRQVGTTVAGDNVGYRRRIDDPSGVDDPAEKIRGGPSLWPGRISTVGYPGLEQGAYRLDTIGIPDSTLWNTWFRTSAIDFFRDGRMAVATYGGDVWIVEGIDDDLRDLKWKRYASGLYEPFGIKVVGGQVYVTCKDRLTRLHDRDGDGEADFYESFSPDPDVSVNFHAFNFDLQVDPDGYFYYAKSGHGADFDLPGAVFRISPDGERREVIATGFRSPNGMGMLPDGRATVSDNQGQWIPASKISVIEPGGFYGWAQTYKKEGMWSPGGGTIDVDEVVPPETFSQPIIWMPQEFDNSSGGQVFADDERWGPLAGRLLHTSFGRGWMSYLMIEQVDGVMQSAIVKLPFDFRTGIMRARVNPADGQVYATGLNGWNGGGRPGLLDGGIQRLSYTGRPVKIVSDCRVESDGLRLEFNFPLDADSAASLESYRAEHWNYRWQASYGSDTYSPSTGERGKETMEVVAVEVAPDRSAVKLVVPGLEPVNQVHLRLDLRAADGSPFREEIYWTINAVPSANAP